MTTRYVADLVLTCDQGMTAIEGGSIDVDDRRIVRVGTTAGAPPIAETVTVGGLLMPGLVNTHAHTPMTLVRGAGDGLPLRRWLTEVMWPREARMSAEDAWWGMTLGSAEMLMAGITTSCEMYLFEEPLVDAVDASGARLVMTPGVLSALHPDEFGTGTPRIEAIADLHRRRHDPEGRITIGVAPHSAYDLGLDRCAELAALARDLDALLHLHLCESRDEGADLEAAHGGRRTVQLLADAGVFEGRVLAAHAVWLDDADIATLAAHRVAVAHCPVSNMKLASGVARVADMRAAGVTVGLGTDGPASNDALDLWQEVKAAPLLARVTSGDPAALGPTDALAMATRDGARALGLEDVGVLAPGYRADFIRLDLDRPALAPITEPGELIAHLGWMGSGDVVTDVWVDGRHLVAEGTCVTVDLARAVNEVQKRGLGLARPSTRPPA